MDEGQDFLRVPVGADARGRRIDHVLLERLEGFSRARLAALIRDGRVSYRGEPVKKGGQTVTEAGEAVLDARAGAAQVPEQAASLRVIHADPDLIVVDKPAGLLTQSNRAGGELGAAELVAREHGPLAAAGGERAPGVVHRLDRDTSGVLLLARSPLALERLLEAFRERAVKKEYLALVHGDPRFFSDWIEAPLGRNKKHPERVSVVAEGGREAATFYEVRERFGCAALVAVFPKTGRTHQVRVHMAHIGHPLLGDGVYRPARRQLEALPAHVPVPERQMLHARALELAHPATRERLRFESPVPADFESILAAFRAGGPPA
jgi:23S rRNA pseudouridine1911/1915/1917 synthase